MPVLHVTCTVASLRRGLSHKCVELPCMFFHIQGLCLWEHQDKLIATQAKNVPCWAQGLSGHADAGESSSPATWPMESLMYLKLSRSVKNTAPQLPSCDRTSLRVWNSARRLGKPVRWSWWAMRLSCSWCSSSFMFASSRA